ncbi:hypothetical protein V3C99_016950 [Haemonchus contortus]
MSPDNLSAVMHGVNDLRLEQRKIPVPAGNQLLISGDQSSFSIVWLTHNINLHRIHTVGICGSDVHFLTRGAIGKYVVEKPMVLGHETSGTVAGMGNLVKGFQVGDRVAIEPGVGCRFCMHCKSGRYNLCPDTKFFATPPTDGSLTRYVAYDADFCFKLPANVSYEEGALIEPLSVAVFACRRSGVQMGQRVLVQGAGPIGTLCMMTARALGAAEVVITDLNQNRLDLAMKLGAQHAICVKGKSPAQVKEEIIKSLGTEPDVSMECSGAQSSIESAILSTRSGGVVVLVGLGEDRAELPIVEAALREVDIRGVFRYANCYPTAINLVASRRIDLSGITRAHYQLKDAVEAFQRAQKGDVIKVFIHCDS